MKTAFSTWQPPAILPVHGSAFNCGQKRTPCRTTLRQGAGNGYAGERLWQSQQVIASGEAVVVDLVGIGPCRTIEEGVLARAAPVTVEIGEVAIVRGLAGQRGQGRWTSTRRSSVAAP